jgi:hypothetical protein
MITYSKLCDKVVENQHNWGVTNNVNEYGGNKSIKENSLRPWVLIPEDNRHSTITRKIPLFSVEPVTISYTPVDGA